MDLAYELGIKRKRIKFLTPFNKTVKNAKIDESAIFGKTANIFFRINAKMEYMCI